MLMHGPIACRPRLFERCGGAFFPVTADALILLYGKAFGRPASSYSLARAQEHEATSRARNEQHIPALDRHTDPNPDPIANPRPSQVDLVSMLLWEMVTGDGAARFGLPVLGSLFIPQEYLQAGHAQLWISGFVQG